MITNRDVADKKNEVTMLRLERDEMLIRRQLDRAKKDSDQHKQICEHCETIGALRSTIGELEERDTLKTTAIDALQNDLTQQIKTDELLRGCIGVLKAELSNCKSAIGMKNGVINDLNETISDLRMAASDMLDTINECARGEAEDSRVLMQVVGWVKQWDTTPPAYRSSHLDMRQIAIIVEDYLAAPEGPVVTLKTPSIGTWVGSKNEETLAIDEAKMRAVHALIGCGDTWVLYIDVDAVEVAKYNQTIDELTETTRKLEGRLSSMYAANSDQDTTINKLNALLAGEKITLAAYRSNPLSEQVADRDDRIEQLMVLNEALRVDIDDHIAVQDRIIDGLEETLKLKRIDHTSEMSAVKKTLHETIKGLRSRMAGARIIIDNQATFIDELNDMYCDVCDKLERIEKIAEHPACDCFSTALDEITKIIQEE